MVTLHSPAPAFSLPDQDGKTHQLKEYLGKWLIVYFYPKDNTPGCTKEACGFRDNFNEFKKMHGHIVGISKDSVKSHANFANKQHLNFPILSDESLETIKAYKAWGEKKFMGKTYQGIIRSTVIVNPEGKIAKVYTKVTPLTHAQTIIEDLRELQKKD